MSSNASSSPSFLTPDLNKSLPAPPSPLTVGKYSPPGSCFFDLHVTGVAAGGVGVFDLVSGNLFAPFRKQFVDLHVTNIEITGFFTSDGTSLVIGMGHDGDTCDTLDSILGLPSRLVLTRSAFMTSESVYTLPLYEGLSRQVRRSDPVGDDMVIYFWFKAVSSDVEKARIRVWMSFSGVVYSSAATTVA